MSLNAVVLTILTNIQTAIDDQDYTSALEVFNSKIKGKEVEKEFLEELSKTHEISFLTGEKKINQAKKQTQKVVFKTTTIRLSGEELEFLRSVGEEEGILGTGPTIRYLIAKARKQRGM